MPKKICCFFVFLSLLGLPCLTYAQSPPSGPVAGDGFCWLKTTTPNNDEPYDTDCDQIKVSLVPDSLSSSKSVMLKIEGIKRKEEPFDAETVIHINDIDSYETRLDGVNSDGRMNYLLRVRSKFQYLLLDAEQVDYLSVGRLPEGKYTLSSSIYWSPDSCCLGLPPPPSSAEVQLESLPFDVSKESQFATLDYSGFWYDPKEPGWGLNIQQSVPRSLLVAAWYGYGDDGQPMWLIYQSGKWLSSFNHQGVLYNHQGTSFKQPYDATANRSEVLGKGTMTFVSPNKMRMKFQIGDDVLEKDLVKLLP